MIHLATLFGTFMGVMCRPIIVDTDSVSRGRTRLDGWGAYCTSASGSWSPSIIYGGGSNRSWINSFFKQTSILALGIPILFHDFGFWIWAFGLGCHSVHVISVANPPIGSQCYAVDRRFVAHGDGVCGFLQERGRLDSMRRLPNAAPCAEYRGNFSTSFFVIATRYEYRKAGLSRTTEEKAETAQRLCAGAVQSKIEVGRMDVVFRGAARTVVSLRYGLRACL